jgi:predicted peptidase
MVQHFHFLGCFAAVTFMSSLALSADNRDRFEARTFADGEFKLPYRLLKPKAYDATQKYPLVIFLHGAGERGDDNQKQLVHGMNDFASDEVMAKYPAFVIAPQCPAGPKWSEVDWSGKSSTLPAEISPALAATLKAADALQKEFSIDPKRIYITGLSMGGYGVWDALARRPELFAAAAIICGGGDPAFAAKIKDVSIWAFHGADDKTVPVERSREMIDALKAAGGRPKYTEYSGVGHNSWAQTYSDPALYDWLFAQRKP